MMTQTHHQLVRDFFTALTAGDLPDELLTADMTMWASSSGATVDKAMFQKAAGLLASIATNGITYNIQSLTAEDDRVVAEIRSSASLVNGDSLENWHVFIFHLRDGQIATVQEYVNAEVVREKIHPLLFAAMSAAAK